MSNEDTTNKAKIAAALQKLGNVKMDPNDLMGSFAALPYLDPLARQAKNEKQARKWAKRVDDFVRWAYAIKSQRKTAFDSRAFMAASGLGERDVDGIVAQAVIAGYFIYEGLSHIQDQPEDSIEEANGRSWGMIRHSRRDGTDPVRFTKEGLAHARQMSRWVKLSKQTWKYVTWTFVILGSLCGLLSQSREIWKLVSNPVRYFQNDTGQK